jgi:hypothetical protein
LSIRIERPLQADFPFRAHVEHRDKCVIEQHYNRASSLTATNEYGRLIREQIEQSIAQD